MPLDNSVAPKPRVVNVGGKASILMGKGDRLVINTPGGGGWGDPNENAEELNKHEEHVKLEWSARGSLVERERIQAGF